MDDCPLPQRDREGGTAQDGRRGDQRVQDDVTHLREADPLAQVLGRAAGHEAADEDGDHDRHDQAVQPAAGAAGGDLAKHHR
jgi:hypothetical protein